MRRHVRRVLRISGLVAVTAVGLLLAAAALLIIDKPLTKKLLLTYLNRKSGWTISAGDLRYRLFPLRIEIASLEAAGTVGGQAAFFRSARVVAGGRLDSIFTSDHPLFTAVHIDRLSVRMNIISPRGQIVDFPAVATFLNRLGPLSITNSELDLLLPRGRIEASGLDLDINSSGEPEVFLFDLNAPDTVFKSDRDGLSVSSGLKAEGKIQLDNNPGFEAEIRAISPKLVQRGSEKAVDAETIIRLAGEFDLQDSRLSLSRLEIELPPLGRASGPLVIRMGKNAAFEWNLEASVSLVPTLELLRPYLDPPLRYIQASGEVALRGRLRRSGDTGIRPEVELEAGGRQVSLSYSRRGLAWRSFVSFGPLDVRGVFPAFEMSGPVSVEKGDARFRSLTAGGIRASGHLRLGPTGLLVSSFRWRAGKLVFRLADEERVLSDLEAEAEGRWEKGRQRALLEHLVLRARDFSPLRVAAEVGRKPGAKQAIRITTSPQEIEHGLRFFKPLVPAGLFDWGLRGTAAFEVNAETAGGAGAGKWDVKSIIYAWDLGFDNATGRLAAAGLAPEIAFHAGYSPSDRLLALDASLRLEKGEALWKEYYIDFASRPLKGRWRGRFRIGGGDIALETFDISPFGFGRISGAGSVTTGTPLVFDLRVTAGLEEPAALLRFLAGSGKGPEAPFSWEGKITADLHLKGVGDSFSLSGSVGVADGRFAGKNESPSFSGIAGRIPLCWDRRGEKTGGDESMPKEPGYLEIREGRASGQAFGPLRVDIASLPNGWKIRPLSLDLWGGKVSLAETMLHFDPRSFRFEGQTSLVFRDGRFHDVISSPEKNPLRGNFSADFPSVVITPEKIDFQGEAGGTLFSGSFTLRNLRLERPFSARRTIRCDVSFAGLNLEELTTSLPFGRVTGIVRGEVEGLAISYGQPESFRFRLESVKKEGIRQTFSLKALDSLTTLTQGGGGLPSSSLFLRFVPAFPYEKIGIECTLKNDVFRLNGLIKEGGVEYLVRRSGPFGINIINRDPDKMISFKEMVGRLKRIGGSNP